MEFSDQLIKQCFQCAFNYYDCPKANLKFSNSNNYLTVQSPLSNSTWLIVAILGMIKAEYDLLFLDHQGQIIDFSMARQVKFVISSVDKDAMDSLLGACSFKPNKEGAKMWKTIILANADTKEKLYLTSKNPKNTPHKIKLKKYSPKLKHRVWFTEIN